MNFTFTRGTNTFCSAEYEQAIHDIENSRLEFGDTPFESLRDLRLVAEAYAIKGLIFPNNEVWWRIGKNSAILDNIV